MWAQWVPTQLPILSSPVPPAPPASPCLAHAGYGRKSAEATGMLEGDRAYQGAAPGCWPRTVFL